MGKIRYVLSNISVVNILLAGVLVAVAFFTFFPGQAAEVRHDKTAVKKKTEDGKIAGDKKTPKGDENPFPTDYMVISEQNLFNPERKMPEQKAEKEAAPLSKPDFVLDGTLITDELKMAFMQDRKSPVSTPGRPNRQTTLRIGDSMSGFKLMQIEKDKVVMQRGEEKIVVSLETAEKDKNRSQTETTATSTPPGLTATQTGPTARPTGPTARQPIRTIPTRRAAVEEQRRNRPAPVPAQQNAHKSFFNIFRGVRR